MLSCSCPDLDTSSAIRCEFPDMKISPFSRRVPASSVGVVRAAGLPVKDHSDVSSRIPSALSPIGPSFGDQPLGRALSPARRSLVLSRREPNTRRQPTPRFRNRQHETPTALTAFGHSPAPWRSPEGRGENGCARASEPSLRTAARRRGSFGTGWRYWGYCARRGRAHGWRWRQLLGTELSEKQELAPQVGLEPTTLRLTAERL